MRDVVEAAGENEVVAEFVKGGRGIEEDERGDEDVDVVVVKGANDAQSVARDEEEGGIGVDPSDPPGFMVAGLIKMQNAGYGKEDREDNRGGFVGGIVPEAAVDWEVLDRWWMRGEVEGRALTILSILHDGYGGL